MSNENKEQTVPFSLRLTLSERDDLRKRAAGISMAAYARTCIFDNGIKPRRTRGKFPIKDHQALSQAIGLLGVSEVSKNLNMLADAAEIGCLVVDDETKSEIVAACRSVQDVRELIMKALGVEPKPRRIDLSKSFKAGSCR